MYQYVKLATLAYLRRVGCRRVELITEHVNRHLRGAFDAEIMHALAELADEGEITTDADQAVWCYLSQQERRRRAREVSHV